MKKRVTWNEARSDCLRRGGDLAVPKGIHESNILAEYSKDHNMSGPWLGIFRYGGVATY